MPQGTNSTNRHREQPPDRTWSPPDPADLAAVETDRRRRRAILRAEPLRLKAARSRRRRSLAARQRSRRTLRYWMTPERRAEFARELERLHQHWDTFLRARVTDGPRPRSETVPASAPLRRAQRRAPRRATTTRSASKSASSDGDGGDPAPAPSSARRRAHKDYVPALRSYTRCARRGDVIFTTLATQKDGAS